MSLLDKLNKIADRIITGQNSQNSPRIIFIIFFFSFTFSVTTLKIINLSILQHEQTARKLPKELMVSRGNIYDRNHKLIATNIKTASLFANPKQLIDCSNAAEEISKIFPELSLGKLKNNFCNKDKSFTWIKHNLTPREQYQVNSLGIPGIYFQNNHKRVYPESNLISHVLGFVGLDGEGLSGIEKQFDNELAAGQDIYLSIDARIQNIVREELSKAIIEYTALGGSAILMDANNGEILSMVSLPDFDPHSLNQINENSLLNRSTLALYEVGSTFKPFIMATAFDKKAITLSDYYQVNQPLRAAKFRIGDYSYKGDYLSVPEIFMYSSNIGTAKIALEVGTKTQREYLEKFGLLKQLDVELPEKSAPMFPKGNWGEISTMTISYGHGIAITPLHVAQAMAALVNGGRLYKASLLKHSGESSYQQILNKQTSLVMRKLLRAVVESGTARFANADGYMVGAKTGTGNKAGIGGYNQSSRVSSTVAAFPIHNPKYVVFVIVDEPKGRTNIRGAAVGGRVAAPVVRDIVSRTAPLLGVSPVSAEDNTIKQLLYIEKALNYKPRT